MQKYFYCLCLIGFLCFGACKTTKHVAKVETLNENDEKPDSTEEAELKIYRGSKTMLHDLVHTKLEVRFDWAKQYLYGQATITLHPHFYPSHTLCLNARGMEIKEVRLNGIRAPYTYDHDSLIITLDHDYTKDENYTIYINYISKPEELKDLKGSRAITSDKGLYFINPLGKNPDEPKEIWTQGETEANSVWFPTIESGNQKMTQEIAITIDSNYVTLSNGTLIRSLKNSDGTRTDFWEQKQPHAPYLAMMAIGEYSIVKDTWRGKEVNYYVEPAFEKIARKIFGDTPEMMEFFSKKLGVDYAWDKYSQVVAREYVSGSMENTSATLHGEFIQETARELLDRDYEEFISHELFHQWFGDLVTCESWSNTPLNESFATYGEYLWNEYKFGREEADLNHLGDLNSYLREAKSKQVDLIRFHYADKEDMFDRHSYEKGGCVLHMLRKVVGDDAFFASLKKYLETNKFKPVEIHQLRLAFEEVTGRDLNWFFNEWFLAKGHPQLDISYSWDETKKVASVTIEQKQDLKTTPLYTMPIQVDIYNNGKINREEINLTDQKQIFSFACSEKPSLINVDAEKMLLCTKNDHHTSGEWITMFQQGKLFQDRMEALQAISKDYKENSPEEKIMFAALKDPNSGIRLYALKNFNVFTTNPDSLKNTKNILFKIARLDKKSSVRNQALILLGKNFAKDDELVDLCKSEINDSSYMVMQTAFDIISTNDKDAALMMARNYENSSDQNVMVILAKIYATIGTDRQASYMLRALQAVKGDHQYRMIQNYGKFLARCTEKNHLSEGLQALNADGQKNTEWHNRLVITQTLKALASQLQDRENNQLKAEDKTGAAETEDLRKGAVKYYEDLKKNEKDEELLKIYQNGK